MADDHIADLSKMVPVADSLREQVIEILREKIHGEYTGDCCGMDDVTLYGLNAAADAILSLSSSERGGTPSAKSEGPSSAGWMDFNINQYFRIRLTERGLQILRERHDRLYKGRAPWFPPSADADGWVQMQAWCVMQDFGPYMSMAQNVPFETGIQVEFTPPAEASAAVAVATATCAGNLPPDDQNPTPTGGGEP